MVMENNTHSDYKLQNLFNNLIQTYMEIEHELVNQVPQSEEIKKLIERLNESFQELTDHSLYNNENNWLYDTFLNAGKARSGTNQMFSDLVDIMFEEEEFLNSKSKFILLNKENDNWQIDLPQYLISGFGTKENLMVGQSMDELLNIISKNGKSAKILVSTFRHDGFEARISLIKIEENLKQINQQETLKINYRASYKLDVLNGLEKNQTIWLNDVFSYIFGGKFPEKIWLSLS